MSSGNPIDMGYITVAERLAAFSKDHPNSLIQDELLTFVFDATVEKGFVVVGAKVWKNRADADAGKMPDGTGLSSMPIPGLTNFTRGSEAENASTSAVGRALAVCGYLAKNPDGSARFASDDEIKAKHDDTDEKPRPADPNAKASRPQINRMFALAKEAGIDTKDPAGKKLLQDIVLAATGKHSSTQLTMADMDKAYKALEKGKDDAQLEADRLAAVLEASGGEVVA